MMTLGPPSAVGTAFVASISVCPVRGCGQALGDGGRVDALDHGCVPGLIGRAGVGGGGAEETGLRRYAEGMSAR